MGSNAAKPTSAPRSALPDAAGIRNLELENVLSPPELELNEVGLML
jgi:hypothetical protein